MLQGARCRPLWISLGSIKVFEYLASPFARSTPFRNNQRQVALLLTAHFLRLTLLTSRGTAAVRSFRQILSRSCRVHRLIGKLSVFGDFGVVEHFESIAFL